MTTVDQTFAETTDRAARRARLFTRINKADKWFQVLGLAWITPLAKAAAGDNPRAQMKEVWRLLSSLSPNALKRESESQYSRQTCFFHTL